MSRIYQNVAEAHEADDKYFQELLEHIRKIGLNESQIDELGSRIIQTRHLARYTMMDYPTFGK